MNEWMKTFLNIFLFSIGAKMFKKFMEFKDFIHVPFCKYILALVPIPDLSQ